MRARRRWGGWSATTTSLGVALVAGSRPGRQNASRAPVAALPILDIETRALRVHVTHVLEIIHTADLVVFAIMGEVTILPEFNPSAGALPI